MTTNAQLYRGLFLVSCLYALLLELLQRRYEPDLTWLTIVIGVAYTGVGVALRLRHGSIPFVGPLDLVWWEWWLWFWSFVASGTPIILWQLWQARLRIQAVIAYLLTRRECGQRHAAPLAEERRSGSQRDGD